MSADTSGSAPARPGRINRALVRMFMKHAVVVESEPLAAGFRLITLDSPAFRHQSWAPGQKVQIAMGSAFVARTYTPIEWDAAIGRTRLVAYSHGSGPGSAWASQTRSGDECDVFGPRASLDLSRPGSRCIVLGDETSIGLACALGRGPTRKAPHCLLEVNVPRDVDAVLKRLDLGEAEVFARSTDDQHLAAMERRLTDLATADDATFVLTGRAASIKRLRRTLVSLQVPSARIQTKAYWAPGKTGLD